MSPIPQSVLAAFKGSKGRHEIIAETSVGESATIVDSTERRIPPPKRKYTRKVVPEAPVEVPAVTIPAPVPRKKTESVVRIDPPAVVSAGPSFRRRG